MIVNHRVRQKARISWQSHVEGDGNKGVLANLGLGAYNMGFFAPFL